MTSSDPARVEVLTPTVTIPAGSFSGVANLRGIAGGTATVLASHANYATAATDVTSTGSLNILESSLTMTPGFPGTIRVQLESVGSAIIVPPPGLTVALTSANSACVSVPASITIPAGQTFVSRVLAHGGTATLPCTTTVTASATGLTSDVVSVTVNPNPGMTMYSPMPFPGYTTSSFPRYLGAGLQDGYPSWSASRRGTITG